MADKHMKKYATSLAIRKMLIKTMLRFYFTLVRMAIIKNTRKRAKISNINKNENGERVFRGRRNTWHMKSSQ